MKNLIYTILLFVLSFFDYLSTVKVLDNWWWEYNPIFNFFINHWPYNSFFMLRVVFLPYFITVISIYFFPKSYYKYYHIFFLFWAFAIINNLLNLIN